MAQIIAVPPVGGIVRCGGAISSHPTVGVPLVRLASTCPSPRCILLLLMRLFAVSCMPHHEGAGQCRRLIAPSASQRTDVRHCCEDYGAADPKLIPSSPHNHVAWQRNLRAASGPNDHTVSQRLLNTHRVTLHANCITLGFAKDQAPVLYVYVYHRSLV